MTAPHQQLDLLPGNFAVARLPPESPLPDWIPAGRFVSMTRTADELSIVCEEEGVPAEVRAERGFRCLRVAGPLAFDQVGILESIARPLAKSGISIFAMSTFDTDYVLVPAVNLQIALEVLAAAGHTVDRKGE